jgi:hypothetical protein
MTDLAYMVREDWAQHGTTMVSQSAVIRDWIGEPPFLFAVTSVKKFNPSDRSADLETVEFIAPNPATRKMFNISKLANLSGDGKMLDRAIVVLHPYEQGDLDALASAVEHESINKVFVMIWSPRDLARTWLDGRGAVNLHTGAALAAPDPLMVAAAESMIDEEYNGLSSGRGKDAVVQLVRAFAAEGYPVEVDPWLRAYFAADGTFRHADSIAKLVKEMKTGTQHRVKQRYVRNIVEVLRDRLATTTKL